MTAKDASTLPGAPQGPILIKWIKDCVQISWEPPSNQSEILEYIIEERQKAGQSSFLCCSKIPQVQLKQCNEGALKDFFIFAVNKNGFISKPLFVQNDFHPFGNNEYEEFDHFSVISKGTKSKKSETLVTIEEITESQSKQTPQQPETDEWKTIPIKIQKNRSFGFKIDSCYISSTLSLTVDNFLFKIVCKI